MASPPMMHSVINGENLNFIEILMFYPHCNISHYIVIFKY